MWIASADAGSVRVAGKPSCFGAPPAAAYVAQDKPLHASLRVTQVLEYARRRSTGSSTADTRGEWLSTFGVPGALEGTCDRVVVLDQGRPAAE